jgi:hypothetical protein
MLYHYSWGIITLLNNEHMHIRLLLIHIFWFLPKKVEGASASLPSHSHTRAPTYLCQVV